MKIIHYIKLHNFKVFGEEKLIELDQPSVLIGPNNSGKTSTLQALALWSIGFKRWYQAKGNSKSDNVSNTGLNRLDIIQVPVQEARFFWKNTEIRRGSSNYIPLDISLGLEFQGQIFDCKMTFTHFTPEVIYCSPGSEFFSNKELLAFSNDLKIEILYPMSGMVSEETLIPEGRINVLIGQGQTAQVLRNLCYQIVEKDSIDKTNKWFEITNLMDKLFQVRLQNPVFIQNRGTIELKYKAYEVKNNLDIALAGRGLQQMLLLVTYLYAHKNAILLLDEPDAHLEILRQKLVFSLLRDISSKNGNQVIIATHSEVILDEASDTNLVMIVDGEPINLAKKADIKNAIKNIGIEHYYKAKLRKSILYVEGSTDVQILKEFAKWFNHESLAILEGPFNYYYTTDYQIREDESSYEAASVVVKNHKQHFYSIASVVNDLTGLAIFDSDGKNRVEDIDRNLSTYYWTLYEIENYFVSPDSLRKFVENYYINEFTPIFIQPVLEKFEQALNHTIFEFVFNNDQSAFQEYLSYSDNIKRTIWLNSTKSLKLSAFIEKVFSNFSEITSSPILLNKGRYFEIVKYSDLSNHEKEIKHVLNQISQNVKIA